MLVARVVCVVVMVLLSLGIAVTSAAIVFSEDESDCQLGPGEPGVCLLINKCPAVLATFSTKPPVHCGFEGITPIVCCPSPQEEGPAVAEEGPAIAEEGPAVAEEGPDLVISPKVSVKDISPPTIDFECGNPATAIFSVFVIGGVDARRHLATYMALLGERGEDGVDWFCDGVLLNRGWVLSAAHCFDKRTPNVVRLGDYDHSDAWDGNLHVDKNIAKVVRHPDYTPPESYHDLMLIQLEPDVIFNAHIKPVCLPWGQEADKNLTSQSITLTGWGYTEYGDVESLSPILQEVNITVFPPSRCDKSYSALNSYQTRWPEGIADETLCAGDPDGTGKDACQGDSGGPVVYTDDNDRFTLAGIVSQGYGCGLEDYPGLYVNVRHPLYLPWIKSVAFS